MQREKCPPRPVDLCSLFMSMPGLDRQPALAKEMYKQNIPARKLLTKMMIAEIEIAKEVFSKTFLRCFFLYIKMLPKKKIVLKRGGLGVVRREVGLKCKSREIWPAAEILAPLCREIHLRFPLGNPHFLSIEVGSFMKIVLSPWRTSSYPAFSFWVYCSIQFEKKTIFAI